MPLLLLILNASTIILMNMRAGKRRKENFGSAAKQVSNFVVFNLNYFILILIAVTKVHL